MREDDGWKLDHKTYYSSRCATSAEGKVGGGR
jgi:hypothetical protein